MSLFSAFVRTAVNVGTLPVAWARDLKLIVNGEEPTNTGVHIVKIKNEAEDPPLDTLQKKE